ncbi:High-copy suppressor of rspA [Candidatus Rubidus massiliensis]|nr:High-copy suppressor of rspA [Candidatus Rubidus massiliensis]
MDKHLQYGKRLAVIYCLVWFIELLDSSSLNVALPSISHYLNVNPSQAEWTIVGFLLSMTIGILLSGWLGNNFGMRSIFLLSQIFYILSSIGCGISGTIEQLILFRIMQGFSAGMAIPLGMAELMKVVPLSHRAKITASINTITLFAPAVGPILGAYVTSLINWRWIFFFKLPLSIFCLGLSTIWVRKDPIYAKTPFDWAGFITGSLTVIGMLWIFSQIGKTNPYYLSLFAIFCLACLVQFIKIEKSTPHPLVPLSLFTSKNFSYGNLIQSAANTIFLGANFLIALYLQQGLEIDLVTTGWIMASITPGMIIVQPLVGKYYNTYGPLPFIATGLIILSLTTYSFVFTTSQTSYLKLCLLIFLIGASSSMTQTANVTSIFSSIPDKHKGVGSSLYSLFKQLSASFGVALTTLILSTTLPFNANLTAEVSSFHYCFIVLGSIPLLSLYFFRYLNPESNLAMENSN